MADINDIIVSSIEGNALEVQNSVNDLMQQKVAAAISQLRSEISSSTFGAYGGETDTDTDVEELDQDIEDTELDASYDDSSLEVLLQGLEDTNDQENS